MKKNVKRLFALLFLVTLSTHINAQNKVEPVKISSIPFPLTWENTPLDYKVEGTGISITAGEKTDIYTFIDGSYYTNNVPKLLFKADSNFIFSAKITPLFDSVYDGGAIILYSDAENWAKLLLEKQDEKTFGLGASVVKNKKTDDSYHPINSKEIYVKVAKSGKIFCFYSSIDGKAWNLVRTFSIDKTDSMKIGFYAQSPNGKSCKVNFTDIKYRGEAFKNFFTGE